MWESACCIAFAQPCLPPAILAVALSVGSQVLHGYSCACGVVLELACVMEGFVKCMQEGQQGTATSSQQSALSTLLHQLEVMACTEASVAIPTSLQPVVQHTLDCITRSYASYQQPSDPHQAPPQGMHRPARSSLEDLACSEEAPVVLDEAWQCLAELLCDEDSWAGSVGEAWLYSLLIQAAEQHMAYPHPHSQTPHDPHHQDAQHQQHGEQSSDVDDYPPSPGRSHQRQAGQIGLLPHPLGGPPKPDAPAHLTHQPELSQLLRLVLSYSSGSTSTGLVFIGVVRRLLLHLKFKCCLGPAEQPQHQADRPDSSEQSTHLWTDSRGDGDRQPASANVVVRPEAEASIAHQTSGVSQQAQPATAAASSDPLADMHPHLMRTSPALSWGQPPPPHHSRHPSDAQRSSLESDDGDDEEQRAASIGGGREVDQFGVSHHRTHSGGLFQTPLSTAGSRAGLGGEGDDAQGQGTEAGPSGAASRALSSMLSTAELSGFMQETASKQEGAGVSHEGVVLHDAPLLGRNSPQQLAGM